MLGLWLGCEEESPEPAPDIQQQIEECDPSDFVPVEHTYCDSDQWYDQSDICEYRYVGELNFLPPTRHQLKYLCPLVHFVNFENAEGSELTLTVISVTARYATQWNGDCPADDDREILYCAEREEAYAILRNTNRGIEFRVTLETGERFPEREADFDRVGIYVAAGDAGNPYFAPLILYQVGRDGSRTPVSSTKFSESFSLGRQHYQDVFHQSVSVGGAGDQIRICYSAEKGILAFREEHGELWTFKDYN